MNAKFWTVRVLALVACTWFGCSSKNGSHSGSVTAADGGGDAASTTSKPSSTGGFALVDSGWTGDKVAVDNVDASKPPSPNKDAGASAADAGAPNTAADGDIPCDVADVLKAHCVRCHGKTLHEGAPYSLVSVADFQRDLGGYTVGSAAVGRVKNDARPMPPAPAARLSASEVSTLETWVNAGAKGAQPGCMVDDSTPPPVMPRMDGGGVVVVVAPPRDIDSGVQVPPSDAGTTAVDAGPPPPLSDWPMFGYDLANSRNNSAESVISAGNVSKLRELWRFTGPSTTSTPAVVEGVVYLAGWDGKVYALRLDDGSQVWTTALPHLIDSSPTITSDHVFVSDDHGSVHSLERSSGTLQWSHAVDSHPETHLWSSPLYIPSAGLLVVGVASGEEQVQKVQYTFRGSVVGLDANTGAERWRFTTADSSSGPGIGVWATASVDEGRRLVFIGTGNNYQTPSGSYSDSLLAIDYDNGQLAWSKQFTSGDTYTIFGTPGVDYDIGSTANLYSIDGSDYVGIGVKNGNYYALDRDSGALRWMAPITGGSVLGGVISASAYADGMIFAVSNTLSASHSTVVSIDARNGEIGWRFDMSNLTYGGVAHANGVVYVGTTAGTIYAFAGATGDMLWVDQTPSQQPIAGSPTIAEGHLIVPWGYQWTLRQGVAGTGGMTVYGL